MALIHCPECGKEISDKAPQCIHCGYPIAAVKQDKDIPPAAYTAQYKPNPKKDNESFDSGRFVPVNDKYLESTQPPTRQAKERSENPKKKTNWFVWTVVIVLAVGTVFFFATITKEHVHNVENWTVVKEASCSETGLETGTCTSCKKTLERSIPKLKHTEGEWKTVSQATIDSSGRKTLYCSVCGAEMRSENIEMTNEEKQKWLKSNCKSFSAYDLDKVARNPSRYYSTYYTFKCKITQVVSESTSKDYYSVYRAQVGGSRDADIYLCIDRYGSGSRILKDDYITVYGTFDGLKTYTTVLGASNTVPKFIAYYYSDY